MSESKEDAWLLVKMGKAWERAVPGKNTLLCYFSRYDSLPALRGVSRKRNQSSSKEGTIVLNSLTHPPWSLEIWLQWGFPGRSIPSARFKICLRYGNNSRKCNCTHCLHLGTLTAIHTRMPAFIVNPWCVVGDKRRKNTSWALFLTS